MADLRAAVAAGLLVAAVALVLAGWAVRRLAGPVFGHELTVLARRGQQPRLRAGLVVVLLGVLLLAYVRTFGWEAVGGATPTVDPRSGRFAEGFAVTVLAVQLLAVMVLTPAVVGSAVTEERDRGTLDLLRTSALTDREIILGKLLARLAVVAGVVAAGLPVLGLTLLFGGVDPRQVLEVYAVTAVTAFGLAAVSLYLGTVQDGLRNVLVTVYGGSLLVFVVCSCLWQLPGVAGLSPGWTCYVLWLRHELGNNWIIRSSPVFRYWWAAPTVLALLYGGGGLWCLWTAVWRVRGIDIRRPDAGPVERQRWFYVRRLGDDADPLVWREREYGNRRFAARLRVGCTAFALFVVGAGLFVGLARSAERGVWVADAVRAVTVPTLAALAVVLPPLLGVRLAGAVAGERERQTLDALLMLPGDRRRVLRAKLLAALDWAAGPVGLAVVLTAGCVLVGGLGPLRGAAAFAQVLAACGFAVGLSGWLTVREATAARATVWLLVGLLAQHVGPLLATLVVSGAAGLSPAVATWAGATGRGGWELLPAAAYAAVGGLLWRDAGRRLVNPG